MTRLTLDRLEKHYGTALAVDAVSLDIAPGEMVVLLGPSGCGKTTTLRMVAGFVPATSGDVLLDGKSILALPPYRREMGLVFQSYALFPHMTVADNIGFGLEMRGMKREPRRARVLEVGVLQLHGLPVGGQRCDAGGDLQSFAGGLGGAV